MAELIVVGFKKDMYRASEVLNTLQDMNNSWVVDLHDAVAVYRDYNGKLRVDQSYQMTTQPRGGVGRTVRRADRRPARSAVHWRRQCRRGSRGGIAERRRARCDRRRDRCVELEGRLRGLRRLRSARGNDGSAR